jgi:hypothetical protein
MRYRAGVSMVAAGMIGVGSIGLAGVGVGVAAASRGSVIHGCVSKSDGALRIVGSVHDCRSREKALSFNKRGPQGARGAPGSAAQSETFQMYANVDAEGDLGSNVDAVKAVMIAAGLYEVTFSKPIGACAASAQPGEAGGTDVPLALASVARFIAESPDTWQVGLFNAQTNSFESSPFMLTVTCKS